MENNNHPLLSVCLITYNHANYIKQAIEGILLQKTDFSWELIIADDCSTDGTREIIIDFQKQYPDLIKLILQEKNVGPAKNWADLITSPTSKYVAYLEGDDYWTDPLKLKRQVDFLEKNPRYVGTYHNTTVISEDKTYLFRYDMKEEMSIVDTISIIAPFHPSSFVFRKNALKLPPWIYRVKSGDMAWYSIVAANGPFRKVGDVCSVYRKHKGGVTNTSSILKTYHHDRIELMGYLNQYHHNKYDLKVQSVIAYHKAQMEKMETNDNFINIDTSINGLDKFFVRTAIKNALNWSINSLKGRLLDAGCGKMPYKEYILKNSAVDEYVGLDIETALIYDENIKPDYTWDGKTMPFTNASFDSCIAVEVLEHCPEPEVFLKEVNRVLKPGSVFFFTVPFLWNLHEVPHDEYRYTPFALDRHLKNSGFNEIEIKAAGGWHAAMAQMLGMWVRRSPMAEGKRKIISMILKPLIGMLIKKDRDFVVDFSESQMITSLYGVAKK